MYEAISERGRVLQAEYQDRLARERHARIPPSKSEFGPDWRGQVADMIARVRALKACLTERSDGE